VLPEGAACFRRTEVTLKAKQISSKEQMGRLHKYPAAGIKSGCYEEAKPPELR